MKVKILHCLFILIMMNFSVMAESMKLEIIPMKNRMVSDVIPIIKPLVAPGGTVTGMNNQLIVKTTPSNLEEIKSVLAQIDNAPRSLMISVKQGVSGNQSLQERALSGRYNSENVRIQSRDPGRGGTIIEGRDSDGNVIRYRQLESQTRSEDNNVFRVQGLEGHPAHINIGQSIPIPNRTTVVTGAGVVVQDGTEYHEVSSGFYVLPRLNGDIVTLLVAPRLSKTSGRGFRTIETQDVQTTASGRLGEWISIGGINQLFSNEYSRDLSNSRSSGSEQRNIMLKVDEIK